ncbi:MAG: hypothetical protein IOD12_17180, partial [Silvanigrellales bacterium]|nr:hypothetical protein [Silvanigrellales bacterium]
QRGFSFALSHLSPFGADLAKCEKIAFSESSRSGALGANYRNGVTPIPSGGNAALSKRVVKRGEGLECLATTFEDADDDALSFKYSWLKNNRPLESATGPKWVVESGGPGDKITCRVVASDGSSDSEPVVSLEAVFEPAPGSPVAEATAQVGAPLVAAPASTPTPSGEGAASLTPSPTPTPDVASPPDFVNAAPAVAVAGSTSVSLNEDSTANIALAQGTDADVATQGQTLQYVVRTAPSQGALGTWPASALSAQSISYTPAANFNGSDSFTYAICDSNVPTSACTADVVVTVTVQPVNDAPSVAVAGGASIMTNSDEPESVVLDRGFDPDVAMNGQVLTYLVSVAPLHGSLGTLPANASTGGQVTYTPNSGYSGTDSFSYSVCDSNSPTNACTTARNVSVSVVSVPFAPALSFDVVSSPNMDVDGQGLPDEAFGTEVIFTVTNSGLSSTALLGDPELTGSTNRFSVTTNTCANVGLAHMETCTIGVTPRSIENGNGFYTASLSIGDGSVSTAPAALSGTATNFASALPAAALSISPTKALNLDVTGPGSPAVGTPVTFTVTNTGGQATEKIVVPDIAGDFVALLEMTADTCDGQGLAPNETCTITVTPKASTNSVGLGSLYLNAGSVHAIATVGGRASGFSSLKELSMSATRTTLHSIAAYQGTYSTVVTVTNNGTQATGLLLVDSNRNLAYHGLDFGYFWVPGNAPANECVGQSLAAGESCTVEVQHLAWADGETIGYVSVGDGTGAFASLFLTGNASGYDVPFSVNLDESDSNVALQPQLSFWLTYQDNEDGNGVAGWSPGLSFPLMNVQGLVLRNRFGIDEDVQRHPTVTNGIPEDLTAQVVPRFVEDPNNSSRLIEVVGTEIILPCESNYALTADATVSNFQANGNFQLEHHQVVLETSRTPAQSASGSYSVSSGDSLGNLSLYDSQGDSTVACGSVGTRTLFHWFRWREDLGNGDYGAWAFPHRASRVKFVANIRAQTGTGSEVNENFDFGSFGGNLMLPEGALESTSRVLTHSDVASGGGFQVSMPRENVQLFGDTVDSMIYKVQSPCSTNFYVELWAFFPWKFQNRDTGYASITELMVSVDGAPFTSLGAAMHWRTEGYWPSTLVQTYTHGNASGTCDNIPTEFRYALRFRPSGHPDIRTNPIPLDDFQHQWNYFGGSTFTLPSP